MASCSASSSSEPKKCVPCSSLDPSALLSKDQVEERLQASPFLALWKQQTNDTTNDTGNGIPMLTRQFVAKDFQAAMDSLQAMGVIAEREGHHPDFHLASYRNVEIVLYTHKLGGITATDIILAEMLSQEVKVNYSPKWLKEHPEALSTSTGQ